jgi:hypothetical protein
VSAASFDRDGEIEALVVDRYLESLLARRPVSTEGVPADLAVTAHRLAVGLPRYHPSFRFEEALAARLAATAARLGTGEVVALPGAPALADPSVERSTLGRPVVIGGVLTSAALSLVGAAWVAWRLGRPAAAPMSRAVRAVSRTRLA